MLNGSLISLLQTILTVLLVVVAVALTWWLFISLPFRMAEDRFRSGVFWVLVSVIFSPFVSILLLWLLDEKTDSAEYDDDA